MAVTEFATFTATVSTTELSIISGTSSLQENTTDGVFQCFLDVSAMLIADVFRFRVYEKARGADTKRVVWESILSHVQIEPVFVTPPLILMNGWDMTIIRVAGTDRTITGTIRQG